MTHYPLNFARPESSVVGYFQGDKTRNSLTQKAEQSDTK
jgi:hypothetical protein